MFLKPAVLVLLVLGVSQVLCDCESLPVVAHSTNNATYSGPYATGTVVRVRCDRGYNPNGDLHFTCNGRHFVGNLDCHVIMCPILERPTNGHIITNDPNYEAGTIISFECDDGYDMIGQSVLVCRVDGRWSPSNAPTCRIKNCGPFGTIVNGKTFQETDNGVENYYRSIVRVDCREGYVLNGDPYVECQANGQWASKPECTLPHCPMYPWLELSCVGRTLTHLNTLYMTCREDVPVTKVGGDSVRCLPSGEWDNTNMACYCDCEVTNMSHMDVDELTDGRYLPHGRTLEWDCDTCYDKQTEENIQCNDGVMTTPVCVERSSVFCYFWL